jgi:hypothetical protein
MLLGLVIHSATSHTVTPLGPAWPYADPEKSRISDGKALRGAGLVGPARGERGVFVGSNEGGPLTRVSAVQSPARFHSDAGPRADPWRKSQFARQTVVRSAAPWASV